MIDPRMNFIDSITKRRNGKWLPLGERLLLDADDERAFLDQQIETLQAEVDKWRGIAERLYNATHESDYTIMMRAARAYEQACND